MVDDQLRHASAHPADILRQPVRPASPSALVASKINIQDYLARIADQGALAPTADTLRRLHRTHLLAVPFENLSIHVGQPIVLDDAALFAKIVQQRRGGFCYELNGLFAALLRALGFEVAMVSAGVVNATGDVGPDFDHMALLVTLEQRWLVDVGFGDSFREPLLVDERQPQVQGQRAYRIDADGDHLILLQRNDADGWKARYRFTLQPWTYADYGAMCQYHQTAPQSPFTQRRICSQATESGHITLSETRLIITQLNGEREERAVATPQEYAALLEQHFGIRLPD